MISKSVSDVKMRNDSCGFRGNNINEKKYNYEKMDCCYPVAVFYGGGICSEQNIGNT